MENDGKQEEIEQKEKFFVPSQNQPISNTSSLNILEMFKNLKIGGMKIQNSPLKKYAHELNVNDKNNVLDSIMKKSLENGKTFDLKELRIKTEYHDIYDYHSLPQGQRFILYYTLGENENFSVQTKGTPVLRGLRIFGLFPSLPILKNYLEHIKKELNQYSVFIKFYIRDLHATNGFLDFPYFGDENGAFESNLNNNEPQIMKNHLDNIYDESKTVENQKVNAIFEQNRINGNVNRFSNYLKKVRDELDQLKNPKYELDQCLKNFEDYVDVSSTNESPIQRLLEINSNGVQKPVDFHKITGLNTIHPKLVKKYVDKVLKKTHDMNSSENFKTSYVKFKMPDDRYLIIRIFENIVGEKKIRISEEALFIIDFDNTQFSDKINEETSLDLQNSFRKKFHSVFVEENDKTSKKVISNGNDQSLESPLEALKKTQEELKQKKELENEKEKKIPIFTEHKLFDELTPEQVKLIDEKKMMWNPNNIKLDFSNNLENLNSMDNMEQFVKNIYKKYPWFFKTANNILDKMMYEKLFQ